MSSFICLLGRASLLGLSLITATESWEGPDMCQELLEALLDGDLLSPVDSHCNSSGLCEGLYWVDGTHHEVLTYLPSASATPVECAEASEWLDAHPRGGKRVRTSSAGNPERDAFRDLFHEVAQLVNDEKFMRRLAKYPYAWSYPPGQVLQITRGPNRLFAETPSTVPAWVTDADRAVVAALEKAMRPMVDACINARYLSANHTGFAQALIELFTVIYPPFYAGGDPIAAGLSSTLAEAAERVSRVARHPERSVADRILAPEAATIRGGSSSRTASQLARRLIRLASLGGDYPSELSSALRDAESSLSATEWNHIADGVCSSLAPNLATMLLSDLMVAGRLCGVHRIPAAIRIGRIIPGLRNGALALVPTRNVPLISPFPDSLERANPLHLLHADESIPWSDVTVTLDGETPPGRASDEFLAQWITLAIEEMGEEEFMPIPGSSSVIPIFHDDHDEAVDDDDEEGYEMRLMGKLMGLAMKRGIRVNLPVTSGFLFWLLRFDPTGDAASSIGAGTMIEWATETDPAGMAEVLSVRTPQGLAAAMVSGTEFGPSNARLNPGNVEEYIAHKARELVITSQMQFNGMNFLRGLCAVLPFGYFEWLSLAELRALFRGHLLSELAVSATERILSRGEILFQGLSEILTQPVAEFFAEAYPLASDTLSVSLVKLEERLAALLDRAEAAGLFPRLRPTLAQRAVISSWNSIFKGVAAVAYNSRYIDPHMSTLGHLILGAIGGLWMQFMSESKFPTIAGGILGAIHGLVSTPGIGRLAGGEAVLARFHSPAASPSDEVATTAPPRIELFPDVWAGVNASSCDSVAASGKIERAARLGPDWDSLSLLKYLSSVCGLGRLTYRTRAEIIPQLLVQNPFRTPHSTTRRVIALTAPFRSPALLVQSIAIAASDSREVWKRGQQLSVQFNHSEARGGGVEAEWLDGVLGQARDPVNGLFTSSDDESFIVPKSADQMRALGRLVGLAIARKISPGLPLTSGCFFWLMQTHSATAVSELELAVVTEWAREESSIAVDSTLKIRTDPEVLEALLGSDFPGQGDNRTLTADNVDEFIDAKLRHMAVWSMRDASLALLTGIYDVLPHGQFEWLTLAEMRTLFSGPLTISLADLRATTTVGHPSHRNVPEWNWFWEIVSEFDQQKLESLLEFVSGSRRPPVGGFAGAAGDRTWLQLILNPSRPVDAYPTSLTCHKQLLIPRYTTKDIMRDRLLSSITSHNRLEFL